MNALRTTAHDDDSQSRDRAMESATWNAYLDKPNAQSLLAAIDFLSRTPDPQSLCRYLTLNVSEQPVPIGAMIVILETSGALRIAGAFGLDLESVAAREGQTVNQESPLAEVIRSGQPRFLGSASEIQESFPEFESYHGTPIPTAIWPINSHGDRIGAIQLFFEENPPQSPLNADSGGVIALIGLYVGLQLSAGAGKTRWSTIDRRLPSVGTETAQDRRRPSGITELSERQATILDHICAGRTNAQIAHVVGFSESTVRQETMAIYRTLGVDGRGQAAAVARAHQAEAAQSALAAAPSA